MFKFRFFSLVVISMMLIVGLAASSVLAKTGGVKVDADGTCDQDREDRTISGNTLCIWLNLSNKNAPNPSPVCLEFVNHDTQPQTVSTLNGVNFANPNCTDTNAAYLKVCIDITDEAVFPDGDYTMQVFDNDDCVNGPNISGDTFELQ